MKRRAMLIFGILAVTSMTWAAAPSPAMGDASKRQPLCNCNDDSDCPAGQVCSPVRCSESGGFFSGVCR